MFTYTATGFHKDNPTRAIAKAVEALADREEPAIPILLGLKQIEEMDNGYRATIKITYQGEGTSDFDPEESLVPEFEEDALAAIAKGKKPALDEVQLKLEHYRSRLDTDLGADELTEKESEIRKIVLQREALKKLFHGLQEAEKKLLAEPVPGHGKRKKPIAAPDDPEPE